MAGYPCTFPRLVPPIAAMQLPSAALLNGLKASDGSLTHTATDLKMKFLKPLASGYVFSQAKER